MHTIIVMLFLCAKIIICASAGRYSLWCVVRSGDDSRKAGALVFLEFRVS